MKRLIGTIIIALLAGSFQLPAQERNRIEFNKQNGGLVSVQDSIGNNLLSITADPDDDRSFLLEISGFQLSFRGVEPPRGTRTTTLFFFRNKDFGFTDFISPDYSLYSAAERGFLSLDMGRSFTFSCDIVGVRTTLNRAKNLRLNVALGIKDANYVFEDDLTVRNIDKMLTPIYFHDHKKKSKLYTCSFTLPVMLEYKPSKFFIEGGVRGELLLGSKTVWKSPKEKFKGSHNLNPLNLGATLRVGYKWLYVFGDVGITPTFKNGQGPKTRTFSVGFGIR